MRKIVIAALAAFCLAGCSTAKIDASDPRRAVTLAPFGRPVGLAALNVPEGTVLYPGRVDTSPAWCSASPTWFAPGGEMRNVCFLDPRGGSEPEGWLKQAYVAGTISSMRLDVDIPYRVGATAPLPPRR